MRIWRLLDEKAEEYISVFLLSLMCILIFIQIIFRYCFKLPLAWSEEIARYAFVWIIYMGASLGVKRRRHLKVDAVLLLFKRKGVFVLKLISNFLTFVFSGIMAYYGTYMVYLLAFVRHQTSPAVGIPMSIPYGSVALGMILMSIRLIQDTIQLVSEYKNGEDVDVSKELQEQAIDDVGIDNQKDNDE